MPPLDAPSLHNVPIPWSLIDRVQMHPSPDQLSARELDAWLSAAGSPVATTTGNSEGRVEPAAGGYTLPSISSLPQPAGAKGFRGALPAGLRKVLKETVLSCHECHFHRSRCVCPRPTTGNGSKCAYFSEAARQVNGHAGPRYTGGRGSRPWMAPRPEVYP